MGRTIEQLEWPEQLRKMGALDRFLTVGMPLFCPYTRERKRLESVVKGRGVETLGRWPDEPRLRDTLAIVNGIVVREMEWPAGHFIPEDRCEVIFKSRWAGLGDDARTAWWDIERTLGVPRSVFQDVAEVTYGEFITRLTAARMK